MNEVWDARFGTWNSRICIQNEIPSLTELQKHCLQFNAETCAENSVLLVCDENTQYIAKTIAGERASILCIKSGEDQKNWETVQQILKAAIAAGLGRDSLFIGVGGGVVCDITAFAASIYMRGAHLVLVPTTLLAMVDAAIGGKTGFDFEGLKNSVGTFRPADLVYMPLVGLKTLPQAEIKNGLAEIIKTAIIADRELLQNIADKILSWQEEDSYSIIKRCAQIKSDIVEQDPFEQSEIRASLNLGHSFGHALESMCSFTGVSHGEAVAWGIYRATALSLKLGYIGREGAKQIIEILNAYDYNSEPFHPLARNLFNNDQKKYTKELIKVMWQDKKKKRGFLRLVLPTDTGTHLFKIDDIGLVESVLNE